MAETYLLTCEHAGNDIPEEFTALFKGKEKELYSHKAIDFGALRLAKQLQVALKLPLSYSTISRLLVEANRSPDSEELFSAFSDKLPNQKKQEVLDRYYFPHRNEAESLIAAAIREGKTVVHLAIHTFTPVLDGAIRPADIGILFDPKRKLEKPFAEKLKATLLKQNPERKVLFNSPYPGTNDGFPTYLRKLFDKEAYAGFEIEVNQKFYLNGEPEIWENLMLEFTDAMKAVITANKRK